MDLEAGESVLSIHLLGRFEVRSGGQVLIDRSWSRSKAKALVKLLALQKERTLHREQVLDALWSDLDPAAAANNFHKNLYYLRTILAAYNVTAPLVGVAGDVVTLAAVTWVDVDEFRRLAQLARAARNDPAAYEQALALYTGDLLPEDIYEDWAEPRREELRGIRIQLLSELSDLYEALAQPERAAACLQQLLEADPLHEEAHRALMRLHARMGSRHRALRQYQVCRDALQRELGVNPSRETESLYRDILEGRLSAVTRGSAPTGRERPGQRRGPREALYGRERELELAQDLLDTARKGQGQRLFASGVAGIGKTRFVQEVLAIADELDALTLLGRSYELETSVAYQPLREMLQQAAQVGGEAAGQVLRRSHHLKRLMGDMEAEAPPAAGPGLLQIELFNEIGWLFSALAAQHGLVLCFDDLHAADEGSLGLVHFLCRELAQQPVLLIATYRTEEAVQGRPLAQLLTSLRREHLVRELTLGPLPERAIHLLIGQLFNDQPVDRDLLQEITAHAEGNPLFAGELMHTLREEGWIRFADGRWQRRRTGRAPVPSAVQDLLDHRLRRLPEVTQQILHLASVLGRDFAHSLLRQAVQLPESLVLDALDDGIAAYIIEESSKGYRFRHDLLREAIYSRLTRARRQQLHRTVATVLAKDVPEAAGQDPELVGYHFTQSDEPWRAVPYLQAAGRRAAAVFANEQAASLYEQALAIARTHPSFIQPPQLAALLDELGDVMRRTGDVSRSIPCPG